MDTDVQTVTPEIAAELDQFATDPAPITLASPDGKHALSAHDIAMRDMAIIALAEDAKAGRISTARFNYKLNLELSPKEAKLVTPILDKATADIDMILYPPTVTPMAKAQAEAIAFAVTVATMTILALAVIGTCYLVAELSQPRKKPAAKMPPTPATPVSGTPEFDTALITRLAEAKINGAAAHV